MIKDESFKRDESKIWLRRANNDLATAEYNFEGDKYDATIFYAHKAAEKALMALIVKKSEKPEHIFDFTRIAKSLESHEEVLKLFAVIDLAYTISKHHHKEKEISREECHEAIKASAEILMWIKKHVE